MKKLIVVIIRNRRLSNRICLKISELIEKIALDPFADTRKQIERIERLTRKQRCIRGLPTLYRIIVSALDGKEVALLHLYAAGKNAVDLAKQLGVSVHKIYYTISTACKKAARALENEGFTEEKLSDYLDACEL